MNILRITLVAVALLALGGCIVAPFGGPGYYGYGDDHGGDHDHGGRR
jgi:hypothetical protein